MVKIDLNKLSKPIEITKELLPNAEEIFETVDVKIFAVNLEYLLENFSKLLKEKNNHLYALLNYFEYYSPINISYDFSNNAQYLNLGEEDEPAMIKYNSESILFFIHPELYTQKSNIVCKSYSSKKNLEPMLIKSPIFAINTSESNLLVPFILMDFEEINLINNYDLYEKYGDKLKFQDQNKPKTTWRLK